MNAHRTADGPKGRGSSRDADLSGRICLKENPFVRVANCSLEARNVVSRIREGGGLPVWFSARPDGIIADTNLENAAGAGISAISLISVEKVVRRHPRGPQKPAVLRAVFRFQFAASSA
jgi:hypothetical protein